MALQKKQSNSSRIILIGVTIAIVGAIGYVLFQQFYIADDGGDGAGSTLDRTNRVIRNFGEDILEDSRYRALVQYGSEPIAPQGTNPNPFQ